MTKYFLYTLLFFIFSSSVWVAQVQISIPDTTAKEGEDIKIPIYVSDLSKLRVKSYYFEIKYDKTILRAKSISDDETVSDIYGWDVNGGFTDEGLFIRADGFRYLSGEGNLIFIKFEVIAEEGFTDLELTKFVFNSGSPTVTLDDGSFRVYLEKKIKFTQGGNGSGQISIDGEKYNLPIEKKLVQGVPYLFEAHPEKNSEFESWSGDFNSTKNSTTYVVDNKAEIIANFSLKTYVISALIEPEGFGQVDGVGVYIFGDNATLIANPYAGKNFINWTINGSEVSKEHSYSFNVDKDVDVVANFETGLFQVSTNTNPIEAGQTTGAGFYFPNQMAEITSSSNEGWIFENWTVDGEVITIDSVFSFSVTDNISLTANYSFITDIENSDKSNTTFIDSPYPNPFNPTTTFKIGLAEQSIVTLQILDLSGAIVENLYESELLRSGFHEKNFNASRLASGVYLYKFLSKENYSGKYLSKTGKLILLK